jgi:hypothetical protein
LMPKGEKFYLHRVPFALVGAQAFIPLFARLCLIYVELHLCCG